MAPWVRTHGPHLYQLSYVGIIDNLQTLGNKLYYTSLKNKKNMQPETTHDHSMHDNNHAHEALHNKILAKDFYVFVGIITFTLIVLQPLSMLAAMFWQAMNQ